MPQLTGPEHPEGNESSVIRVLLDGTLVAQDRYRVIVGGAEEAAKDDALYVPGVFAAYRDYQPLARAKNAVWSVSAPSIDGSGWMEIGTRAAAESWLREQYKAHDGVA